ncbi:MAG: hypothetical protein LBQ34_02315 [Alphaproteobacteria bacterium]|jgi:hypothetical protein|nr:hypothetical protein [Alphaproteobacteria bacterium]
MVITVSQILIFICIIFFTLFNLIAVYLYQESYNYRKVEIKNSQLAWRILSNMDAYKDWWHKFVGVDHVKNYVKIEETHGNLFLKISISNLSKSTIAEHWTFVIKDSELLIKKETMMDSKFANFKNKYCKNHRDIKNFINNFNKEQEYLSHQKNP